ncbi:MAG: outer membrane protein assembly factor BamD [Candidatus Cloacimonetes bacterium]|nr:outer membrane protein assembly factor BamD [Candidatus Cloacimonadota bacterium]
MKKHKNYCYGVCVDGLLFKVAELEQSGDKLILHRLEDLHLAKPLFSENQLSMGGSNSKDGLNEVSFESNSDEFDIENSDMFGGGGGGGLDSLDDGSSSRSGFKTAEEESRQRNEVQRQSDSVQKFINKFHMNDGKVSTSAVDNKLDWKFIKTTKKCNLNELKKMALSNTQMKDINCSVDFMPLSSTTYNAVIHQGTFDIMAFLNNVAKNLYGKKSLIHYKYIEPLNISILNIFNLFYPENTDQYTTVLYLGDETKVGFIIKDKKIVKDFPIMIFDTDPERVREAVFAKLMLEKESSEFPLMDNIILAGDFATEDDINFYNKRTGKQHSLFSIQPNSLKKQKKSLQIGKAVDIEQLPSFIIPLSLALKTAIGHNPALVNINLLPKRIIESRQVFRLGGPGWVLLILCLCTTFGGANHLLNLRHELKQLKNDNANAERELNELRAFRDKMKVYQNKAEQIQAANARSAGIAAGKNAWSYIFYTLTEFTNSNPLLWIDNITTTENRFAIKGKSYYRDRITNLSTLFADGQITRIMEIAISDHTIWEFDMDFARPQGADIPVDIPVEQYATLEAYRQFREESRIREEQEELLRQAQLLAELSQPVTQTPASQSNATTDAKRLYDDARNYYINSNFTETTSLLDQYIRRYPNGEDIAMAYYVLGELYYVLGNYEKAVPNFNNVYRLKQDKVIESLFFLAKSNEKLSDYGAAIRHYNILINEYPNSGLARTASEQVRLLQEGQ